MSELDPDAERVLDEIDAYHFALSQCEVVSTETCEPPEGYIAERRTHLRSPDGFTFVARERWSGGQSGYRSQLNLLFEGGR